jgi:5-methylcytosine-specific restriction protein A
VDRKSRNPVWTRDELIVALDFYLQHSPNIPGKSSPKIRELSEFLNRLGQGLGINGAETFRNRNGVYMKLMNFRRLDPKYSGKGLERGGAEDEVVWNKYSPNPNGLRELSENIRLTLDASISNTYVSLDEDEEAEEGRLLTGLHRYRERDPKLVKRKKARTLQEYGVLLCEVCQFNFSESYGSRGDGYIECHHRTPVSELKPGDKIKLSDLSLVCSNCHRMIHRRRPWPTVNELKTIWAAAHPRESPPSPLSHLPDSVRDTGGGESRPRCTAQGSALM